MTAPESMPPIDPRALQAALSAVRDQIVTALLLSAGMICAVAALACLAFRHRRSALALGFLYAFSLCFVHNGHAQVLGPFGCTVCLLGFWWPEKSRPERPVR